MLLKVTVATPRGSVPITCKVHVTQSKANRLIDPEFYKKWCSDKIPEGTHCELELVEPPNGAVHVHMNPHTGVKYVCWTGHLPDIIAAKALFGMWCLGNAYTRLTHEDFQKIPGLIFQPKEMAEFMATVYNIKIGSSEASDT